MSASHSYRQGAMTGLNALCKRESEIAHYVAEGYDNNAIAQKMGIKVKSVTNVLFMIGDKLEIPPEYSVRVCLARMVWDETHG